MAFNNLLSLAIAAIISLSVVVPSIRAEDPLTLKLWPGMVPGDESAAGTIGEERFRLPEDSPTKDARWLTNVTKPTLTVYKPPKTSNTGVAMLICPGGGYWNLAWDLEGEEVAHWLNSIGITGIVLKYRVPRRPGQPELLPAPGPLLDAQRAISVVRSSAKTWKIDPHRIGIVGFSAGGHLAIAAATNYDRRGYEHIDAVDNVSCRPDFAIAVYPGYLVEKGSYMLASSIRIPAGTPPVMLVHAADDTVAGAENSMVMFGALKRAGIPSELHIYSAGQHGFGVRKSNKPTSAWTRDCITWLRGLGVLTKDNSIDRN